MSPFNEDACSNPDKRPSSSLGSGHMETMVYKSPSTHSWVDKYLDWLGSRAGSQALWCNGNELTEEGKYIEDAHKKTKQQQERSQECVSEDDPG